MRSSCFAIADREPGSCALQKLLPACKLIGMRICDFSVRLPKTLLVAQISNLLYRRLAVGKAPAPLGSPGVRNPRRLKICDTADYKSALRILQARKNRRCAPNRGSNTDRLLSAGAVIRWPPMKTQSGNVEIPIEVLESVDTLDELEDWLTAQNPRVVRELRQARKDDLAGKFKPWKPRQAAWPAKSK